jgi:serine protease Do
MIDPLTSKTRVLLLATAIGAFGLAGSALMGWTNLSIAAPAFLEQPQVDPGLVQPAVDLSTAFINIAEAVTPAVVRIEVERPARMAASGLPPGLEGFDLPDWMLPPQGRQPRQEQPEQPRLQTTGGSGFVVTDDGYILTNDHVVSGATAIRVYLPDGREYSAELVGADPTTDVAVVKVNDRSLPVLSLGSSSGTRVGEWVLAVGNPGFGGGSSSLDYTVTAGIVSAIGRPLQLIQNELRRQEDFEEISGFAIEDFIQTDAAINPGNSGGPLVNMHGQVIGVNSAIASRSGRYEGYGFAIPMDLARRIMEDLIEYGQVRRPLLGIEMVPVSNVDAEYYGLPRNTGVLIAGLSPDGPAASAGLREEDVVVAIDGESIDRPGQLQLVIAQRRPGDQVTVRFYRDGEPSEVRVRLGEADLGPRTRQEAVAQARTEDRIGIELGVIDERSARELGYDSADGVFVRRVSPSGPAARAGLTPGQRVLEINRQPVDSVEEASGRLSEVEAGGIASFRIEVRPGQTRVINLRVPG